MQIEQEQKTLRVPTNCQCFFDHQSCCYVGVLTLINSSDCAMYIHVTSTFAHFLKFENLTPLIKPSQNLELKFKIKQVNQIIPGAQYIFLSWSKRKGNQYCSLKDSALAKITLGFDQQIIEDSEIDKFLECQALVLYKKAQNHFNQGNFIEAGRIFEECFLLYRKKLDGLLGMAKALFEQKNIKQSLGFLELCIHQGQILHEQALLLKATILETYIEQAADSQKYDFLKTALDIYSNLMQSSTIRKGFKIRAEKGYDRLNKNKQSLFNEQINHTFDDLIQKAINQFSNNQNLAAYFDSKHNFQKYLKGFLQNQPKDIVETPDFAIDPIQYEIYKEPMITPAGHSYEKQFLVNFLKKTGPKDPQTREYLNPNSIVPNITLKILVRNNPDLPKWIKYENNACKF